MRESRVWAVAGATAPPTRATASTPGRKRRIIWSPKLICMCVLSLAAGVDDRELANVLPPIRQRDVEQVHAARHELAAAVAQIPVQLAATGERLMVQHIDQYTAQRVDAD